MADKNKYPEIKDVQEYVDEIKLQISNIMYGPDTVTEDLAEKLKKSDKARDKFVDTMTKYAKEILTKKPKEEQKESEDTVDSVELTKFSSALKLHHVLKICEHDAEYWMFKVDSYGAYRKKPSKGRK